MRSFIVVAQFAYAAWAQVRPFDYSARPVLAISPPLNPASRSVASRSLPSPSLPSLRSASVSIPTSAHTRATSLLPADFESVNERADTVTLYRISGDECSQSTMNKRAGAIVMRLVKLKRGTCASQGFVEAISAETMTAPIIGETTVSFFGRRGHVTPVSNGHLASSAAVTLYKISRDECGETKVDRAYAAFAVYFANLKKGTCASQGFSQPDGFTQTISLPLLGKSNINYFKKAWTVRGPFRPLRAKVRALSVAASTAAAAGGAVTGATRTELSAQQLMPHSTTVALIGLIVSSGVVVALRRFHHSVSSVGNKEPLLSIC